MFFALDADFTKATDNQLKYVYRGPPKDTGKKLYYIQVIRYGLMIVVFTILVTNLMERGIIGPNLTTR